MRSTVIVPDPELGISRTPWNTLQVLPSPLHAPHLSHLLLEYLWLSQPNACWQEGKERKKIQEIFILSLQFLSTFNRGRFGLFVCLCVCLFVCMCVCLLKLSHHASSSNTAVVEIVATWSPILGGSHDSQVAARSTLQLTSCCGQVAGEPLPEVSWIPTLSKNTTLVDQVCVLLLRRAFLGIAEIIAKPASSAAASSRVSPPEKKMESSFVTRVLITFTFKLHTRKPILSLLRRCK